MQNSRSQMEEALRQAASQTFEELAFLTVDDPPGAHQKASMPTAWASVRFQGSLTGELRITLCGDMLDIIAENMLGEPELDPHMMADALGEVANVLCGNLLPRLAGPHEIFRLDKPRTSTTEGPPDDEPSATVSLGLERGRADLLLYVHAAVESVR